jgi:hypothetical protein
MNKKDKIKKKVKKKTGGQRSPLVPREETTVTSPV